MVTLTSARESASEREEFVEVIVKPCSIGFTTIDLVEVKIFYSALRGEVLLCFKVLKSLQIPVFWTDVFKKKKKKGISAVTQSCTNGACSACSYVQYSYKNYSKQHQLSCKLRFHFAFSVCRSFSSPRPSTSTRPSSL